MTLEGFFSGSKARMKGKLWHLTNTTVRRLSMLEKFEKTNIFRPELVQEPRSLGLQASGVSKGSVGWGSGESGGPYVSGSRTHSSSG